MDISHLLDGLNDAQRSAVCTTAPAALVLAGAGSGKTRVLVHRIGWLTEVERVSPFGVLAVTFTNKAAGEMRARTGTLTGPYGRGLTIGTFHGIAHRLLRQHAAEAGLPEAFQILDSDDQQRLVKKIIVGLELDDSRYPARQATWYINDKKDEGRRPSDIEPGYNPADRVYLDVYRAYEDQCRRAGLVDFAELLLRTQELLLGSDTLLAHYRQRYEHLLIDEFQDTNTIQYAFIRLLAGKDGKVFVVGDDDQSIYGWRGAKVENVQQFLRDFPGATTIRLEQNYRSSGNILSAANAVIANNQNRLGKNLWTDAGRGEAIDLYAAYNGEDEARFVVERIGKVVADGRRREDCAILYRSNAQSRLFEEQLLMRDVPYRVYGGQRFFERAEIKDAMAYLRLIAARNDDAAFERAVNMPPRGIGERSLDQLRLSARGNGRTLWEAALAMVVSQELVARSRNALRGFLEFIESLATATAGLNLSERVTEVVLRSGLRAHYQNEAGPLTESRIENLEELSNVAARFVHNDDDRRAGFDELSAFLSHAALEAGEGEGEAGEDCVQLMSLHSAKGLEFEEVFLVGLEEGLFPSQRSVQDEGRLEEERRLAYVGITRARRKLTLCYAESRRIHGMESLNRPSRFVNELPKAVLSEIRPRVQVARPASFGRNAESWLAERGYGQRIAGAEAPAFRLGQNVRHDSFGEGVVTGLEGAGDHARVQVRFAESGSKWLVTAYAKLQSV